MAIAPLHLRVHLGVDSAGLKGALEALPELVGAGVDQVVRKVDRGVLGSGLHGGIPELHLRAALDDLGHTVADLSAELVEGVELRRGLGEVVVELGQFLLAHFADLHVEDRRLARQVLGAVVLGEADVEVGLLAGALADESFFELGQKALGAELHGHVRAGSALERFAVNGALVVDDDHVAVGGGRARPG